MSWFFLAVAISFEICGTMSMKMSATSGNHIWSVLTGACYITSFTLFWFAVKKLDIGVAYAVWAGVGVAAVAVLGMIFFSETMSLAKITFIALIVVGVAGLKVISS